MFFSLGLHGESSPVQRHSSKYTLCKVSPVGIQNIAVMLSVVPFPHLGGASAGVAPLPPRFRKFLDETVKTLLLFPSR